MVSNHGGFFGVNPRVVQWPSVTSVEIDGFFWCAMCALPEKMAGPKRKGESPPSIIFFLGVCC